MEKTQAAVKLIPKEKIKKAVHRKEKETPRYEHYPIKATLASFYSVLMIVPAVIAGVFTFFGAGFEAGVKMMLEVYRKGVK